jgi:hypothetical protein
VIEGEGVCVCSVCRGFFCDALCIPIKMGCIVYEKGDMRSGDK